MTALAGVELQSLVSEPDALTTRPPLYVFPLPMLNRNLILKRYFSSCKHANHCKL